jgi:membrane-associated protein
VTLLAASPLSPDYWIDTFGLIGLLCVIFAECGLLIGFFLPGDTLLFSAGLLVSSHHFHQPLWLLFVLTPIAAIAGNLLGYWIGWRTGPAIFNRPESKLFKRENVERAQAFFDKYGPITILLARFVPVVRTFVTVIAGASRMRFRTYATYTVAGGLLWTIGVVTAGYYLGRIKIIADHVDIILVIGVLAAVVMLGLPAAARYVLQRRGGDAPEAVRPPVGANTDND